MSNKWVINPITSNNYEKMWCKHRFGLGFPNGGSVNYESLCCGKSCPSLVFTDKNGENGKDGWIGYCGIDHRNIN